MIHGRRPISQPDDPTRTGAAEPVGRRAVLFGAAGAAAAGDTRAPVPLITVSAGRVLTCGEIAAPCAIGRGGIRRSKHEGDGATPAGTFPLRRILYRPDRVAVPETGLPIAVIAKTDGWCTDPRNAAYNQPVALPYPGPHENLWRDDPLYDLVIVVGYNDAPVEAGRGSAIFLHVARPALSATDGCVAVPIGVLLAVARHCDVKTMIEIRP